MKTCEDCGCRVYEYGCVNCNEPEYIRNQEGWEPEPMSPLRESPSRASDVELLKECKEAALSCARWCKDDGHPSSWDYVKEYEALAARIGERIRSLETLPQVLPVESEEEIQNLANKHSTFPIEYPDGYGKQVQETFVDDCLKDQLIAFGRELLQTKVFQVTAESVSDKPTKTLLDLMPGGTTILRTADLDQMKERIAELEAELEEHKSRFDQAHAGEYKVMWVAGPNEGANMAESLIAEFNSMRKRIAELESERKTLTAHIEQIRKRMIELAEENEKLKGAK